VFRALDNEEKGYLTFEDFCGLVQKQRLQMPVLETTVAGDLLEETKSIGAPSLA